MPACDAFVVCRPAYLLCVARRASASVPGFRTHPKRMYNGRVDPVSPADCLASSKILGMKCDAASGLGLRISELSVDVSCAWCQ